MSKPSRSKIKSGDTLVTRDFDKGTEVTRHAIAECYFTGSDGKEIPLGVVLSKPKMKQIRKGKR